MLVIRLILAKKGVVVVVFEKLRKILAEQLDIEESEIEMNSRVVDDLGADSLDIVDLVMSVEEEFDISFEDEQIEKFETMADIVNCIEQQLK